MKQFDSGAKSSEVAPRLDLIPVASLRRQAARMAEGAASHGERNYEKGAADPAFIRDRKNHMALHVALYLAGDTSDDHLGAILANAGMLARLEELAAVQPAGTYTLSAECGTYTVPAGCSCASCQPVVAKAPPTPEIEIMAAPMTYDERRAAAQPCTGCGQGLIQNGTKCRACRVPAVPAATGVTG